MYTFLWIVSRYLRPISFFFFFNDTATTEIYTLSLHDALPIYFDPFFKTADETLGRMAGIRTLGFRATIEAAARLVGGPLPRPGGRAAPAHRLHPEAAGILAPHPPLLERPPGHSPVPGRCPFSRTSPP